MGRILIFIFLILIALGLHYADKRRMINLGKWDNKEFEAAHINDALILEVRHKYEVRIVGVHENGASQEIEFRITKLDN
jgi:hypothetical protein